MRARTLAVALSLTLVALVALTLQAPPAIAAQPGNVMPSALIYTDTLTGSAHSWGFGALDPTRPYLFIARRENGVSVFDVVQRRQVRDIPGTAGANAVAFAPALDRAFVVYMDGTLGILRLSDLLQLQRISLESGNLNNAVFDAISGKLIVTGGRRAQRSTIYQIDPLSGKVTRHREFDAAKFDAPVGLSDGSILLPLRDEGRVMRISAATLEPLPGWAGKQFANCAHPSAVAADEQARRLFIACRGKSPQLIVAHLDSGTIIATLPATPAINALAWDGARRRLLMPSGQAASLTLIGQQDDDASRYRTLGYVGTRPWAHNMVYDPVRGLAYLFTMDFTQAAPDASGTKHGPQFQASSFTVMSISFDQPSP